MTGKFIRYFLIILAAIAFYIFLLRERVPFGEKNSSFASKPKKEITGIELSDKSKMLKLTKEDDGWFLNDMYEARKNSIAFINQILTGIEIKSPVTPGLFNEEIINKGVKPVRVKVFENKKIIKSFYVYKTHSNIYGNIMKMREGSKPFIVYLPGFETDIGSVFTVNKIYWLPFTVFNLLPSEIASLTFENFADTSSSFAIRNNNFSFFLSDMKHDLSGWDTSRVVRYISYFVHVPFESWEFDLNSDEREKLKSEKPLYRIAVTKNNGEMINLSLWERINHDQGLEEKDTDRLWAKTDASEEIFIIRYLDIDPLIKKRSYFFP